MDNSYSECVQVAQQELQLAVRLLQDEMKSYPTPIAGCDAQFNHLLAEQQRIRNALDALRAAQFVATPRQPDIGSRIESR